MRLKITFYAMWPVEITPIMHKGYERHICRDLVEARSRVEGHPGWSIEVRTESRVDRAIRTKKGRRVKTNIPAAPLWTTVYMADGQVVAKDAAATGLVAHLEQRRT